MSDQRINFVGFWPWPRVWVTEKAGELAASLPRKKSVNLSRELTIAEAAVFREVAHSYNGSGFRAQLCADGLLTYRHEAREDAITENWERAKKDILVDMLASSEAWGHYVVALNILFLLVESGMHIGRNNQLYWIEPLGRTGVVRVRYDSSMVAVSQASYGPITEMGMARAHGPESIGARVDGSYQPDVVAAFQTAMPTFEQAHSDARLWDFLDVFAASWSLKALGHWDAAVMLTWSLIERHLVRRVTALLATLPSGAVMRSWPGSTDAPAALPSGRETDLRRKITKGESPMAGKLICVLAGNGETIDQETMTAKGARDRLAHGGGRATAGEAGAALKACIKIAAVDFGVQLAPNLHDNPHLGLT